MGSGQLQRATGKLEHLAEQKFGKTDLKRSERTLIRAAPNGDLALCGPNNHDKDPNNDPSKADAKWPDREIRAEVIHWLCVDKVARSEVDPKGIRVYGARITGKLDLTSVIVPFPLELRHCRLTVDAELTGAQLPLLNLQGSWVCAIEANNVNVNGDVFLGDGFHADGTVWLRQAQIGGNLDCAGGTFENRIEGALTADGIHVRGDVFLSDGFDAEGEVRLPEASIGGSLVCQKGKFLNPSGRALNADHINVQGYVFLSNDFHADGEVWLPGAQIGANLECIESAVTKLTAAYSTVKGIFWWLRMKDPERAALDLRNASVGSMADDERSWPEHGKLSLDGFVYGSISKGPTDADSRFRWLARQDPIAPQPYRQLAKVLRERGDDDGALRVLQEIERLRRMEEDHTATARLKSWVLKDSIGYGYFPGQAIWGIAILSGLGWIIYRRSYLAGNIAPKEKDAYESFKWDGQPPPHYTPFAPLVYSIENSLPLVKLGQEDTWHPKPDSNCPSPSGVNWPTGFAGPRNWTNFQRLQRRLILWGVQRDPNPKGEATRIQRFLVFCGLQPDPDPKAARSRTSRWFTSRRFVRWFLWIQILLGWLLATLFLAGVTGLVHK